jgi:hypothetical protein
MKIKHLTIYVLPFFVASLMVLGKNVYAQYDQTTTTTTTTTSAPAPTITTVTDNAPVTTTRVLPTGSTPEHQYISFDINMNPIYQSNQRVDGQVVIHNAYREALPAEFHVKLYQQDALKKDYVASFNELLPGDNVVTLDKFGIPDINNSKRDQGDWTIVVYPSELGPDYSKEAKFKILSSLNQRER